MLDAVSILSLQKTPAQTVWMLLNSFGRSFIENLTFKHFCFFILLGLSLISCRKTELNPVTAHTGSTFTHELANNPPNVILILADDMGYEVPTYTGGRSYSTPNIDMLAQSGLQFTQFHATPLCSPSRVELLSGKYNFRNYIDWGKYDTNIPTIANLLKNAGYATCAVGKWQLDGGDTSLRKMGFDKYRIYNPYEKSEKDESWYRYKNPHIYENSKLLPTDSTNGKYADDMFFSYASRFIDKHLTKPFFIYYSFSLCHAPFVPTPDDPEYATWTPESGQANEKFYSSMVKYLDKKVGELIKKINSSGLAQNTVILFLGDNGTPKGITSLYYDQYIDGGKNKTTEFGTRVPFIVSWPGVISGGKTSNHLCNLTDIMPTLAAIANTQIPPNFGITDGVSFYPTLQGVPQPARQTLYTYFKPMLGENSGAKGWAQTNTYKLYDSGYSNRFYNIVTDKYETTPLKRTELNAEQKSIRDKLSAIIKKMHN